ncbi:MAG: hypothetical protein AB7E49_03610 [Campylobacterales bacterium]
MSLRSALLAVSILLTGCLPPQSSMTERTFATVSYVRAQNDTGLFDRLAGRESYRQDLELFLDDGRLFTVPGYEAPRAFRLGDRVLLDYVNTHVVKIRLVDEIPLEEEGFYAD